MGGVGDEGGLGGEEGLGSLRLWGHAKYQPFWLTQIYKYIRTPRSTIMEYNLNQINR